MSYDKQMKGLIHYPVWKRANHYIYDSNYFQIKSFWCLINIRLGPISSAKLFN